LVSTNGGRRGQWSRLISPCYTRCCVGSGLPAWSVPVSGCCLLRVFGRVDKREKLLDALDDTWRRLGRIDLIAGADLATRTMGSLMLEAFLLRRTDEQFLKTAEEVDLRLEHLHSRLEGDARYPINSVYCYATAWQHAVAYMAPKSDAVLWTCEGFTKKNQGCVFELTWGRPANPAIAKLFCLLMQLRITKRWKRLRRLRGRTCGPILLTPAIWSRCYYDSQHPSAIQG